MGRTDKHTDLQKDIHSNAEKNIFYDSIKISLQQFPTKKTGNHILMRGHSIQSNGGFLLNGKCENIPLWYSITEVDINGTRETHRLFAIAVKDGSANMENAKRKQCLNATSTSRHPLLFCQ